MEGVVDATMRDLLTRIGNFDRCVTEFVRVPQTLLPSRVFHRFCPELENNSRTPNGTPVYVQLLGGDATMMAKNAARAASLGCAGIDLNFGCPAKTVNKHDGGSILLKEPQRVRDIVSAVRDAVPAETPVSVKIRLGVQDSELLHIICCGIEAAGAAELCIHARTKTQGYKPPAHWREVHQIRQSIAIPLIINGEIWTPDEAACARKDSGCSDIMLGRGAIACPDLSRQIRARQANLNYKPLAWTDIVGLLQQSFHATDHVQTKHIGNRLRQWLIYLQRNFPEAIDLFSDIKTLRNEKQINAMLERHLNDYSRRCG